MSWVIAVTLVLIGLFFSGLFSGAETGLYCVSRPRLHLLAQKNDSRAKRVLRFFEDEPGALCVMLLGTNMMNYLITQTAAYIYSDLLHRSHTMTEVYTVMSVTPVVFVLGEVVPKNLFQTHADALMLRFHYLLLIAGHLFRFTGLIGGLKALINTLDRLLGGQGAEKLTLEPKRRVAMLVQEGIAVNELAGDHFDLIDRVCLLSELPLRRVMIPIYRVLMLSASSDRNALGRIARRTDLARVPVYEKNRWRIVGVAKIDRLLAEQDWKRVGERLEQPVLLHGFQTVGTAFSALQRHKTDLAIIIDRTGTTLGIVTLSRLIDSVIGGLPTD